jgi:hypothetical protein
MTVKERGRIPPPKSSASHFPTKHRVSRVSPQDLLAEGAETALNEADAGEIDRAEAGSVSGKGEQPSTKTIAAMLDAMTTLYDSRIIRDFRLFSSEHRRLEQVRGRLAEAIRRSRRNARRRR